MNNDFYQGLDFDTQRKLDQKAYTKYYANFFSDNEMRGHPKSFNTWYGSEQHKKDLQFFLRKYKLKKLGMLFPDFKCFMIIKEKADF